MLGKKNLDELSQPAREFYERARMKMTMSLILISMGLFFIGLCCLAGGQSLGNDKFKDSFPGDDAYYTDLSGGYGFACFMYILAFFVALAAAVYVSPLYGTKLEATMLKSPQELTSVSGAAPDATMNPAFAHSGYPEPQANKL